MAVRAAGAGFSHMAPSDRAGWDGRYTGAPMSTRAEVAVLGLLPLGLLAARALALDGPAVWCAAAIVVLVPGWAAVRLLRLERHVGMSGAIPVAFGLGLAVCRTIISAQGGRLWAANNTERGATFHFTLPSVEATL